MKTDQTQPPVFNLHTFFEKFELFADAPDSVAKMRELVLQLAVRGKLVAQSSTEGDADSLLEAIAVARKKNGRRKPRENSDAEELAEVDGWNELPVSWRWVRLSTIGDIVGGGTPRSDNSAYFADKGIPWLTPADLNGFKEKRIRRGRRYITKLGLENSSAQLLPEGSILFSSRAPIGYVAIAGTELATNQGFKSCVPFIPETNEFLYYYLKCAAARIDREASGTTFREVSGKIVNQIPVPLPPLAEQKRIVAKVDELMALCDRLEVQQRERETRQAALARAALARFADAPTPANLQFLFHSSYTITPADLRKSILTLAVQGKLVPQDPNDEQAEELIGRIAAIRHAKKAKQYDAVTADEPPYDVPFSWSWVRLGSISLTSDSGWSPQCLPEPRTGSDWGVLKVSAVSWGVFKPEENKALPPGMTSRPASEVKAGDFLLSRANTEELVARSVVVAETPLRLMMSDKIVRFIFPEDIDRAFINLANTSEFARAYYVRNASGTSSSMKNVGREVMSNLPIPLPPLAEQRRIVAKVDQLMALVDQLEAQLAASRATAANLLSALVAELTTQA
jgi:type I restriction enzyme S subunit